jgi:hypothetical protein
MLLVLVVSCAVIACTTRSIFMNREPLTSTLATRGSSASTAALSAVDVGEMPALHADATGRRA